MEYRILLVEDDQIFAFELEAFLVKIYSNRLCLTHCSSANEAAAILANKTFDLLLIDVVLETETAGIQLAESVNPLEVAIIFITAFQREDLFQRALKVGPANFLHKPFSVHRLRQAIEVALSRQKIFSERGIGRDPSPILLKRRDGQIERVHQNTIIAIEAYGNYCHFYLTTGRRLTQRMKLKEYQNVLPIQSFLRIHRSWVINLDLIERLDKENQKITVSGKRFPVGLKYKTNLFAIFQKTTPP